MSLPALTLYTRADCPLCEAMQEDLTAFQQQHAFSLNLVDIDSDSYLQLRYGERVPLLAAGEEELCHYRFNEEVLLHYFRNR